MISLAGIYIYPIKSTAPVALDSAIVEPEGLADDRRYVVTNTQGRFFTARRFPRMVLIDAHLQPGRLQVAAPDQPPLELSTSAFPDRYDAITVWRDTVQGQRCGEAADRWFSTYLGTEARLYHMGAQTHRPARDGGEVSFADSAPLLVISQASVADLNTRLAEPAEMRRFRPNLVVSGCEAYAEDSWPDFEIGTARFRALWRCARCILTTVDPDTGIRHPDRQPLMTLMDYRRGKDNEAFFGRNAGVGGAGSIEVGQALRFI